MARSSACCLDSSATGALVGLAASPFAAARAAGPTRSKRGRRILRGSAPGMWIT